MTEDNKESSWTASWSTCGLQKGYAMCEPLFARFESELWGISLAGCTCQLIVEQSPEPAFSAGAFCRMRFFTALQSHKDLDLDNPKILKEHAWLCSSLLWDDMD